MRLESAQSRVRLLPARDPERALGSTRVLSADGIFGISELPALLGPGDVLVLNNASTLPASLSALTAEGCAVELRLLPQAKPFSTVRDAVLLGEGDWRTDTDARPAPPTLHAGARVFFRGDQGRALVRRVHPSSERLLTVELETEDVARFLFENARPIQYAHMKRDLRLGEVQTPYGGPAWSVEMPSTGRPISFDVLRAIKKRGAEVAWLTHGAGLSATGDPRIDRLLPLPERYAIPCASARAIQRATRVIATGTTVVRALESATRHGAVQPGNGVATLVIGPDTRLQTVSGILTGLHSPGESHWELLRAFAADDTLHALHQRAARAGLLAHEFGDLLFLPRSYHASHAFPPAS